MMKACLGVLVSLLALGSPAWAAKPTVAEILRFRPSQEGVNYSTPSARDQESCIVELVSDGRGGNGWLLKDPQGRSLRRFFDSNGDRKPDVWSYYLDGVEAYREMDTQGTGKPDHFRWLNAAGMKYGIDTNKDGKIDTWKMISAEEASQEVLAAVVTRDLARLQALFITEAEIQALGLPQDEATRLTKLQQAAPAKLQATIAKLTNVNDKTRWVHVETGLPACVPAEAIGSKYDVIKYVRVGILYETEGKQDWINVGDMIRVGVAWRLTDAPAIGQAIGSETQGSQGLDPILQSLLEQLRQLDQTAPRGIDGPGGLKALVDYNLSRATLLEQVVAKVKAEEREQWIRQIADSLSAAAQNSGDADSAGFKRLTSLEQQIIAAVPNTPLAAYVTFRVISAENAARLAKAGPDIAKAQEQWLARLSKFVEQYPAAEDTPEALMQLGMVSEFVNQESQARKWYSLLAKNFAQHPYADKARGAEKRLEIDGKPLELAGPVLGGGQFNVNSLAGKIVVVYYWASWNKDRCVGDFATLQLLLDTYGNKGFAVVCVNLDQTQQEALAFVQRLRAPGVHLFQPGGLDGSPLATQYGVMFLPHMFLVDKDGKVINRTLQQVTGLEEELKKRLN